MKSGTILIPLVLIAMIWQSSALADTVILKNGQELDGTVIAAEEEAIILDTAGGPLRIRKEQILQVFVGDEYRNASPERQRQMVEAEEEKQTQSPDPEQDRTEDAEATENQSQDLPGNLAQLNNDRIVIWAGAGPAYGRVESQQLLDEFRTRQLLPSSFLLPRYAKRPAGIETTAGFQAPLLFNFRFGARVSVEGLSANRELVERGRDLVNPTAAQEKSGVGLEELYQNERKYASAHIEYPFSGSLLNGAFQFAPLLGYAGQRQDSRTQTLFTGILLPFGRYTALEQMQMDSVDEGPLAGLRLTYFRGPIEISSLIYVFHREGFFRLTSTRLASGGNAGLAFQEARMEHIREGVYGDLSATYWIGQIGLFLTLAHQRSNMTDYNGNFYSSGTNNTGTSATTEFQTFLFSSLAAMDSGDMRASSESLQFGVRFAF